MGARDPLWFGALLAAVMPLAYLFGVPFQAAAPAVPSEPTPVNTALWIGGAVGMVLLATAFAFWLIWLVRTGRLRWIRRLFLGAVAVLLATTLAWPVSWASRSVSVDVAWLAAFAVGVAVVSAWARWGGRRTGNVLALLVAAGMAGVLGSVFDPLPMAVFLGAFVAYDLWAVRRTGHMQRLAVATQRLDLPLLVSTGPPAQTGSRRPDTASLLVGIGDLMLPAAWFVAVAATWGPSAAVGAWLGTLAGAGALWAALRRRPVQPGLPWLVGGGVLGAGAVLPFL